MAKYVLQNQSQRLIHVPIVLGSSETVVVVPGDVQTVEVTKDNEKFFKATVKDVQGLLVLTEDKYNEYLKNKAAMDAVLNDNESDDEPAPATTDVAPVAAPAVASADGWVR